MSKQGPLGWLLLTAVLAVPGFLFYRWRTRLEAADTLAISRIAKDRLPAGSPFGDMPLHQKLSNPLDSSHAAASPAIPPAAVPPSAGTAAPAPLPPAATPAAPVQPAASPLPPSPGQAGVDKTEADFKNAESTADYSLAIARDPTLSPYDYMRIRQMDLAARIRHRPKVIRKKMVPRKPPVESTIELQGIISSAGVEPKAIINGDMIGMGQSVNGARVVRIASDYVLFDYRGRKFKKILGK